MRNDVNEVEYVVNSFQADIHQNKSQGILINVKEASFGSGTRRILCKIVPLRADDDDFRHVFLNGKAS